MASSNWQLAISHWPTSGICRRPSRDYSQWTAAVFSLTVARQRGNCTRFPVFATRQRRANRRTFQRTGKILVSGIYRAKLWEVKCHSGKIPAKRRSPLVQPRVLSTTRRRQQAQLIRIFSLQGANQQIKLRMAAQIFQAGIFQKKRPAGETSINASLKPVKCDFRAVEQ